jgi:hypothetical protein
MTTIPRSHKKRFNAVLTNAEEVKRYDLDSSFVGVPTANVAPINALERYNFAKLQHKEGNKYVVHVHSNLWYEFTSEG